MKRILSDALAAMYAHETLVIWFFFSFLLVLTGPFGTYGTMTFHERLVYWPGLTALSIVLGCLILYGYSEILADFSPLLATIVRVLTFAFIFTPILHFATLTIVPDEPMKAISPFVLLALVIAITFAVALTHDQFQRLAAAKAEDVAPRLLLRLPRAKSVKIVRLTVEDHYVIVFLEDGSAHRLLMRFGDAVAELQGLAGHCSHRSHWVADAYVAGLKRQGAKEVLLLTTGDEIPIGNKYRPGLVEAGLIAAAPATDPSGQRNSKATPPRENSKGGRLQEGA